MITFFTTLLLSVVPIGMGGLLLTYTIGKNTYIEIIKNYGVFFVMLIQWFAGSIISSFLFFWLYVLQISTVLMAIEGGALAVYLYFVGKFYIRYFTLPKVTFKQPIYIYLTLALTIAAVFVKIILWYSQVAYTPYGYSDSLNFWNLRALNIFYNNTGHWKYPFHTFTSHYGHIDYPLFFAGLYNRVWVYMGYYNPMVMAWVHFFTLFMGLAVLFLTIKKTSGILYASLSVLVIISLQEYFRWLGNLYMDPMLAVFLWVGTALFFAIPQYSAIMGLIWSSIVWIKSEGMVYYAVISIGYFTYLFINKYNTKHYFLYLLGSGLAIVTLLFFKLSVPKDLNDFVSNGETGLLSKLFSVERHATVWDFITNFFNIQSWYFDSYFNNLLFLLFILILFYQRKKITALEYPYAIAMVLINIACIYIMFVFTALDIRSHMEVAFDRLFIHHLPSLVLLGMINIKN